MTRTIVGYFSTREEITHAMLQHREYSGRTAVISEISVRGLGFVLEIEPALSEMHSGNTIAAIERERIEIA